MTDATGVMEELKAASGRRPYLKSNTQRKESPEEGESMRKESQ